jgi:hypothetical protein
MTRADLVQPPLMATWLVNLFAPPQEESIVGDLLEEFSRLASKSGAAFARRWYWRQAVNTIAHLFGAAFRDAPWSTSAAVVGGFFLGSFLHGLPDKVLSAVTDRYLTFWSAHFQAYLWVLNGMLIAHLMLPMCVGCMVALAAKGREMVATITLSLVLCAMTVVAYLVGIARQGPTAADLQWFLFQGSGPIAILVGGVMVRTVRTRRSAATVRPSTT